MNHNIKLSILLLMMKLHLLLPLLLIVVNSSWMLSRPIRTSYDQYGKVSAFIIPFKVLVDLTSTNYFQIQFPSSLAPSNTTLKYQISTFQQPEVILIVQNSLPSTTSTYYLPLTPLTSNVWYAITIFVQTIPTTLYGLVQMKIVSGLNGNIEHTSNTGFQYYHIDQTLNTSVNINLAILNTPSNSPAAIYPLQLSITPQISSNNTVLTIKFSNSTIISNNISSIVSVNNDFIFLGSCTIICNNSANCLQLLWCRVTDSSIQVGLPSITANKTEIIEIWVRNPDYVSHVGVECYWSVDSAGIGGIGIIGNALSVSSLTVLPDEVYLLWGIPYTTVVNGMGLGIFLGKALNNLDIGFQVSSGTPIGTQLIVKVYLGASGVLQNSINHNLPPLDQSLRVLCRYITPYIECSRVGSLTKSNFRYYVRVKASFANSTLMGGLGSVSIDNARGYYLLDPLVRNLNITAITSANYLDVSGIHNSTKLIEDTMVVSMKDTSFPDSLSNNIYNLLNNPGNTIGIDPSISKQQLLFLLNVNQQFMLGYSGQMASPTLVNQTYTMKVFINPNVIVGKSTLGIDFAAYNLTSNKWQLESAACYVDALNTPLNQKYMCQKYDDHLIHTQVDNFYAQNSNYGLYTWICGDGQIANCSSGDCQNPCRIFRGYGALAQSDGGLFSIRNVTFPNSYHSPIYANQYALDFVIAFYHGTTLISSSLINAYTINSPRLNYVGAKIINYYSDGATYNTGQRIPTMLNIYGNITLQEIPSFVNSLQVFIPKNMVVGTFIQPEGRLGCSTSNCYYRDATGIDGGIDSWIDDSSIQIFSLPPLTYNFNILVPIQLQGNLYTLIIALKNINNSVLGVYRLNGSAVNESLTIATKKNIIQTSIVTTQWNNQSYWVSTLNTTFNQGIDITRIVDSTSSNQIKMNSSILSVSGSTTFTTLYTSIFSDSTFPTINTNTSCLGPFKYLYLQSPIYVIWCPTEALSQNTINIPYPIYPSQFGSGFPFSTAFTYAYSSQQGYLEAYRVQTANKTTFSACTTNQRNQYYLHASQIQQNIFEVEFLPLFFSSTLYTKLLVEVSIPSTIFLSVISCQATQMYSYVSFGCIPVSNSSTMLLQLSTLETVPVMKLQLRIKTVRSATPTTSATASYSVNVYLPHTSSNGTITYYGTSFSPYKSKLYNCINGFTYSSILPSDSIQCSNINFYGSPALVSQSYSYLTTNIEFLTRSSTFFASSTLRIVFSQSILSSLSNCKLNPYSNEWLSLTSTSNTLIFTPKNNIYGFTSSKLTLQCANLLTVCPLTFIVYWYESTSLILQSPTITVTQCTNISASSLNTVTLSNKLYNTLAYYSIYSLSYSMTTNGIDILEMFIIFIDRSYIPKILSCLYDDGSTVTQILCYPLQNNNQLYIKFIPKASSVLKISIEGLHQEKYIRNLIHTKIKYINQYYIYNINDNTPSLISNPPILLISANPTTNNGIVTLSLTYQLPINHTGSIYIQIDNMLYISNINHIFTICTINGISYQCVRKTKNIIKILSSLSQVPYTSYTVVIQPLYATSIPVQLTDDGEYLNFRVFLTDTTQNTVTYGSHSHLLNLVPLSAILPLSLNYFQWLTSSLYYHEVYIGYFKTPAYLYLSNDGLFERQFSLTLNSSWNWELRNTIGYLGYNIIGLDIGELDNLFLGYGQFNVNHNDPYYPLIDRLNVFVSDEKCNIISEKSSYDIFSGGVSLPILIDFSLCRPISPLSLSYSINNPNIYIDASLSTMVVDANNYLAYIVLRHQFVPVTTTQTYSLTVSLNGTYAAYFSVIPTISVRVVANSGLIGNPQGKQPVITSLNDSSIKLMLQCNQPSTIYWALGVYPTILGISPEEIQARLIENNNGFVGLVNDPYEWSLTKYGLSYAFSANIDTSLTIGTLSGNKTYVFRYFCLSQLGKASGAKNTIFNTPSNNYELLKVILAFNSMLNYSDTNLVACAIAQTLIIPYKDVTTSTFSNCLNFSDVFYKNDTYFYDTLLSQKYSYNFYIKTQSKTNAEINTLLVQKLYNSSLFQSGRVILYKQLIMNTLYNSNTPQFTYISHQPKINSISISVDVGPTNSYLIAAIMQQSFDPSTMSIPQHYLIKKGYFSANTPFDDQYMIYCSGLASITFNNLTSGTNYSIFYFTTVDDPSLNSRSTQVSYINIQTSSILTIDLYSENMVGPTIILLLLALFI